MAQRVRKEIDRGIVFPRWFACCFQWNPCPLISFSPCCGFSVGTDSCGTQGPGLRLGYRQGLTDRVRSFGFAGRPGWQELAYRGSAMGVGGEFSPLIRAFRGVRGDVPPAGQCVSGVLEVQWVSENAVSGL